MDSGFVIVALVLIALAFVVLPVGLGAYSAWRRPLRLTCPRTRGTAQITVDAMRAAVAAVVGRGGAPVVSCSLWRRVRGCREECGALPAGERHPVPRGTPPPRPDGEPPVRRILVPLDGTPEGEAALDPVLELARAHHATIRLLHVARLPSNVASDDGRRVIAYADQEIAWIEDRTRAYFAGLARRLTRVPVEEALRFGDPAARIVEEAEATYADLIALPDPGRGAFSWWRGARLVRRLERATRIPLLLVPSDRRQAA